MGKIIFLSDDKLDFAEARPSVDEVLITGSELWTMPYCLIELTNQPTYEQNFVNNILIIL